MPALARLALAAAVAAVVLGGAHVTRGDSSSAPPASGRPPSCAERFPDAGPAGVDLRLGCIVSVVVGAYTTRDTTAPPPLSSYAIAIAGLVTALGVAIWLAGRLVSRRAGRRLAPVLSDEWWVCASCRSVNGAGVAHCYACGAGRSAGPMLTTDESPGTPQSFGARRKNG